MNILSAAYVLGHIVKWRLTCARYDGHYKFAVSGNSKFMGARDAAGLVHDGDVVAVSGLGSSQWVTILYYALRDLYRETGHPRDLTVVAIGGIGARSRAPGSIEELGVPGLCTRLFGGHLETFKSLLRLADAGQCELQCLPQGILALLLEAQQSGNDSLLTSTGVGTFMDPRVGRGTPVNPETARQWVTVEEGDKLRYRIPRVNVAMWNAPAADREGNIYLRRGSMIAEIPEITRAARRNGGKVIANVGLLVEKGYGEVLVPAEMVDAIVVYPNTEQVGSVKYRKYWPMFTTESKRPARNGVALLKFANEVLGITPRRSRVDSALARLTATVFCENLYRGSLVNIGVGLPEEACRIICEAGLEQQVTFFSESGVIGGLPAPGVFFGAAVSPQKMISSAQTFHMCYDRLDVSILGMLQADSEGNVNVSKRGEGAINYVGPGGFIDFTTAARTIIFISSWMIGGKMQLQRGRLRVVHAGKCKFVERVDEITFSGQRALHAGKQVFYVTNVGVFRLTARGMELIRIVPGIDVQRDIIDFSRMQIILPENGKVPVAQETVLTGKRYSLSLQERPQERMRQSS